MDTRFRVKTPVTVPLDAVNISDPVPPLAGAKRHSSAEVAQCHSSLRARLVFLGRYRGERREAETLLIDSARPGDMAKVGAVRIVAGNSQYSRHEACEASPGMVASFTSIGDMSVLSLRVGDQRYRRTGFQELYNGLVRMVCHSSSRAAIYLSFTGTPDQHLACVP